MTLAIVGWAVIHSLWQWTVIAGVAALLLGCLRTARARTRYAVGGAAFIAMMAVTLATVIAAAAMLDPSLRHRALYAFKGALIMPELFARGSAVLRAAALLWAIGVFVGVVRLVQEVRRMRTLTRLEQRELDAESRAIADALRREMRIRCDVTVHHSTRVSVPMVLGAWRPRVLLPADAARALTIDERRGILVHELGHVRHGDVMANFIQVLFDLVTFHHPAARWISSQLRREREYACDELVVAITGDAHSYARALAMLEDARSDCRLAVAAASGTLLDRIERIVGRARPALTPVRGAVACVVAVVLAVGVFILALNMPPPWMPAGIRLRMPGPQVNRGIQTTRPPGR